MYARNLPTFIALVMISFVQIVLSTKSLLSANKSVDLAPMISTANEYTPFIARENKERNSRANVKKAATKQPRRYPFVTSEHTPTEPRGRRENCKSFYEIRWGSHNVALPFEGAILRIQCERCLSTDHENIKIRFYDGFTVTVDQRFKRIEVNQTTEENQRATIIHQPVDFEAVIDERLLTKPNHFYYCSNKSIDDPTSAELIEQRITVPFLICNDLSNCACKEGYCYKTAMGLDACSDATPQCFDLSLAKRSDGLSETCYHIPKVPSANAKQNRANANSEAPPFANSTFPGKQLCVEEISETGPYLEASSNDFCSNETVKAGLQDDTGVSYPLGFIATSDERNGSKKSFRFQCPSDGSKHVRCTWQRDTGARQTQNYTCEGKDSTALVEFVTNWTGLVQVICEAYLEFSNDKKPSQLQAYGFVIFTGNTRLYELVTSCHNAEKGTLRELAAEQIRCSVKPNENYLSTDDVEVAWYKEVRQKEATLSRSQILRLFKPANQWELSWSNSQVQHDATYHCKGRYVGCANAKASKLTNLRQITANEVVDYDYKRESCS